VTLFLETGAGLHRAGHVQRDSAGTAVAIRVNENSYPFIHDWDEDGRRDLILGESYCIPPDTGNVRIYKNCGTNGQPAFTEHFLLQAGGQLLFHPRANPTVYDLDADGAKDLVLGNDNGYVYFYCNTGTNEFPAFAAEYETLKTEHGGFIDALTESRLRVLDWNGDADLDLLLGGQDGYVWIYENATDVPVAERASGGAGVELAVAPDPFRTTTTISMGSLFGDQERSSGTSRHRAKGMELRIYDISGGLIRSFSPCSMPSALCWNGRDQTGHAVPGGVYFVRLNAGDRVHSKKIVKLP
jgi:hypothetical protein